MESKRSAKISVSQQRTMLEFLSVHPELTSGKFTSSFTYKQAQLLWHQLTAILNAIPGANKTWVQWRKTWQDKRNKTRTKKAKINIHRRGTGGGGEITEVLTPVEEDVLCLIAPTQVEGHADIKESATEFDYDFKTILGDDVEIVADQYFSSSSIASVKSSGDTSAVSHVHVVVPASTSEEGLPSTAGKEIPPTPLADTRRNVKHEGTPSKTPAAKKKRVAVQRLHHSLEATATLTEAVILKNQIKQNYYKQKIELLAKQTNAFDRMATALEKLANK